MYWGAGLFRDLKTITIFLYLILSIRGIEFSCFNKGGVGALVGRSYIILAALFCNLKSRSNWALPQTQLK